ncbi:MAG: hypothetical protein WAO80_11000 [Caldicoprobacterales bacterium]
MYKNHKLVAAVQIAFAYVGTVVGAGFASGQEVMGFFTIYGDNSLWAILISSFLFVYIGIQILLLGMELGASSFKKLMDTMFGFLSPIVSIYLIFAMMVINMAMLAGAGAVFQEFGKMPYIVGVIITALIAIVIIGYGIKGVLSINKILITVILAFQFIIVFITLFNRYNFKGQISFIQAGPIHLIKQGISYASFNIILSTGVLAKLGHEFKDRDTLVMGGLIGGCILGFMLLVLHFCLLAHIPDIFDYEIPVLYIISDNSWFFSILYSFVVWGAILTTLVGNLYSMTSFFHDRFGINHLISATLIVCSASFLSTLGFSSIVNTLYPIVGLIGVIFIVAVFFYTRKL